MARKSLREPKVDTELAYAYAKTDRLHDMEDFLGMTNVADILEVGEKCFEDELYQAAKLLFTSISNWARLATTLIYLGENQAAVESARKAGNTQVWKQVHAACLETSEFRLAQICGLNIVVHAEELPALIQTYERRGYFDEVLTLLEAGLSLERAHVRGRPNLHGFCYLSHVLLDGHLHRTFDSIQQVQARETYVFLDIIAYHMALTAMSQ